LDDLLLNLRLYEFGTFQADARVEIPVPFFLLMLSMTDRNIHNLWNLFNQNFQEGTCKRTSAREKRKEESIIQDIFTSAQMDTDGPISPEFFKPL